MILTRGYPIQADDIRRALERPSDAPPPELAASCENRLRQVIQDYLQARAKASSHGQFMEMADRLLVAEALRLTNGNQTHAARLLGLTRPTLQAKMHKYGIRRETGIREA